MTALRNIWQRIPLGILLAMLFMSALASYALWHRVHPKPPVATFGIITPDGMSTSDPALSVWLDAAHEEGMLTDTVSVSSLTTSNIWGDSASLDYRVLILPDQILRHSNSTLLKSLEHFVRKGGHLLVCFDAMTRYSAGEKSDGRAMLSELVGIDYALFDTLGTNATAFSPILGSDQDMSTLQIPPGKPTPWPPSKTGQLALTTYQYGFVTYPHFVTRGNYQGHALLSAPDGSLILGQRPVANGSVVFANVPLGDLKGRTDGLLLHAALKYIADIADAPTLLATPGGIGGLVFNWHIDANSSLNALDEFERRGLFSQGPFSIHITAGPDAHLKGDGAGMNLGSNPAMQQWVKRFQSRGDSLGNHGGWIHDYFGTHVDDGDRSEMQSLLKRNDETLSRYTDKPILEYSAPLGNQPEWVTSWIEKRGVLAYYFTGNTGMAPTRSYRNGMLNAHKIWSFPILTLNQIASFEEALDNDMSPQYLSDWLISIAEFSANSATVRTFYSHPTGWKRYFDSMQKWFDRTRELNAEGRFRWYTMERIASFLNRREEVQWHQNSSATQERITASHSVSLKEMSWRVPKRRFARPVVVEGNAEVYELNSAWVVVAGESQSLTFDLPLNSASNTALSSRIKPDSILGSGNTAASKF